ncbi:RagB/SusD family nutrient uptake outer membrane protein [Christiangramia sp. LLG6405-1]|uniref:RagB/SusD family nutrient uptake outer membrane protein n=1 Tax=Christiangramia sp. LLG6405-1 TaxID=3160832 RepID=UPI00386D89A8
MKIHSYYNKYLLLICSIFMVSCEEFVEVDAPNNQLVRSQVFESEETALGAMQGIYNQLYLAAFSSGSRTSVTLLAGLSADNIQNISTTNLSSMEFEQNEIQPDNTLNLDLWKSAYNMIYLTNSFLEGLEESTNLGDELKEQLQGEARFVRAFTYFQLVNIYGDIPLILSTNYQVNELASRSPQNEIYEQILEDLHSAEQSVASDYRNTERTGVNIFVVKALLSRVYLYMEDWQNAENFSSQVIAESGTYEILDDLNQVFLANSKEAIWQISPIGGGGIVTHTNDGALFIIDPVFSFFASIQLRDDFVARFEDDDIRRSNWIGFNESKNAYFSYKYKIRNSTMFPIQEYSMVLRLAEQYLIRAEARAQQGNLSEAIQDLDIVRERAGLEPVAQLNPEIEKDDLLVAILQERRKELFTEWGHRWLDLKRTNRADQILSMDNPFWEATDVFYPIPSAERMKNPNLSQNNGY